MRQSGGRKEARGEALPSSPLRGIRFHVNTRSPLACIAMPICDAVIAAPARPEGTTVCPILGNAMSLSIFACSGTT
jgi:hypothetical protein